MSTGRPARPLWALTENSVVFDVPSQLFNYLEGKNIMSKFLTTLLAAIFASASLMPVAFAQEKKKSDPVAAACKGKKPGDMVKVDGKDVKCPAPKSAPAK